MWEIDVVMKRKGSNCVGILADQGRAKTASNLSENTILMVLLAYNIVKITVMHIDQSHNTKRWCIMAVF